MKCKTDGMHFPEIDFYLKIQYTYRMSSKIPKKRKNHRTRFTRLYLHVRGRINLKKHCRVQSSIKWFCRMCLAGFFQHADVRLLQAFKINSFVKIVKDDESLIFSKKFWRVWQSPEFVSGSTNLLIRPIVAFNIEHNSFFSELLFVFLLIILFTVLHVYLFQ